MLRKLASVLLLTWVATGLAQEAPAAHPLPDAVIAYAKILAAVERSESPTSLEPLFNAGEDAQNALMRIDNDKAYLESLSDSEFAAAQAAMRGFQLSHGYDIYALPLPPFFENLAKAHGKPEDIRFFTLARMAQGENFLPLYLRDKLPTPCVRYGEGVIAELYENWRGYAKAYPKAYKATVQQYLKDLEETLVLGTCACGDAKSVQGEQKAFLRRFPKTVVAQDIRKRMHQLDVDPEVQPVNCR